MQKYVITMQNMHKSMYRHILHIYALPSVPTLLTEAQARAAAAFAAVAGDIRVASVGLGAEHAVNVTVGWGPGIRWPT